MAAFDTLGGITRDKAQGVTELFMTELASKGILNVVDRSQLMKKEYSYTWGTRARVYCLTGTGSYSLNNSVLELVNNHLNQPVIVYEAANQSHSQRMPVVAMSPVRI